jgi:3-(3-hydroxy-phenyl)propionate hydroxylase
LDNEAWRGGPRPGTSMVDAPITGPGGETEYLTDAFLRGGRGFTLLAFANGMAVDPPGDVGVIRLGGQEFSDPASLVAARYDAKPGTAYLLRPDGYVAARFRQPTRGAIDAALARASGNS